jgi:hypothetical protein
MLVQIPMTDESACSEGEASAENLVRGKVVIWGEWGCQEGGSVVHGVRNHNSECKIKVCTTE